MLSFEKELSTAAGKGHAVHILGHIPPYNGVCRTDLGGGTNFVQWQNSFYTRYVNLIEKYKHSIKAQLYGHTHTEWWMLTRACHNQTDASGNITSVCDGEANGVLIPGAAMTEGFPARNPSLRLVQFDAETFDLVDIQTYRADLHSANKVGKLRWHLAYSFRDKFKMESLSAHNFEKLHKEFKRPSSRAWDTFMGQGDGSIYCSGYNQSTAPFPPALPCLPCSGKCKDDWIKAIDGFVTDPLLLHG